ncbi:MAG: uracil-DNA glycosylase family protein [Stenotrophomonas sp.]
MRESFPALMDRIARCAVCAGQLPHPPRPVVQAGLRARLLIVGQAPGRRVDETGIPFNDPSGDRLRDWLGIDSATFYDPQQVAIVPMGFCYPGSGKSGDLPPRPECAPLWHPQLLPRLKQVQLTLAIGQYAQAGLLGDRRGRTLTDTVQAWQQHLGHGVLPLPHPSPRNRLWLARNPWFEAELLPVLRQRVGKALAG